MVCSTASRWGSTIIVEVTEVLFLIVYGQSCNSSGSKKILQRQGLAGDGVFDSYTVYFAGGMVASSVAANPAVSAV
jgi:hypothetical protein